MSDSSSGSARKNPRSAERGRAQLRVGPHIVEPLGHRPASDVGGDGRVPSLFGEPVRTGELGEASASRSQPRATRAADDAAFRRRARAVAQAAAQNRASASGPSSSTSVRISCCASSIMSPPASACWPSAKPSRIVQTRPPTRSRASTTVTSAPMALRVACGGEAGESCAGHEHRLERHKLVLTAMRTTSQLHQV